MAGREKKMRSKVASFFEGFIVIAILLVLVQTFMEDFGILADWQWETRRILVFTGFAFDLIFTVEFLTRLFYAIYNRKVGDYLFFRRGWVDFVASVPLLMLNSGPAALTLIAGGTFLGLGGFLNVLKVVKAIRIARILRLLRVLKIFKQIKYAESVMAQRHVAKVTSICISVFIFSLFAVSLFAPAIGLPTIDNEYEKKHIKAVEEVVRRLGTEGIAPAEYSSIDSDFLILKYNGQNLFSKMENGDFEKYFGPGEYRYVVREGVEAYFDLHTFQKYQAKDNLIYFAIIVILVIVFLIYYSPHFAITVSDPIHVMRKGFEESSYNLEVRVPPHYAEDDIFVLAGLYNKVYLPMKDRSAAEDGTGMVDMQLDDFNDLFEEGADIPEEEMFTDTEVETPPSFDTEEPRSDESEEIDFDIPEFDAGPPEEPVLQEMSELDEETLETEVSDLDVPDSDAPDIDLPDLDEDDFELPDLEMDEEGK